MNESSKNFADYDPLKFRETPLKWADPEVWVETFLRSDVDRDGQAAFYDRDNLRTIAQMRRDAPAEYHRCLLPYARTCRIWIPDYEKALTVYAHEHGIALPIRRPTLINMADVEEKEVDWLWWPYLARGTIVMLDGDPGLGKSLFTMQLGAILSRGYPLPDQQGAMTLPTGGPQRTLLLSAEDSLSMTIKRRLRQGEADARQVTVLTGWLGPEDEEHGFTLQHMALLDEVCQDLRPALVVIDPIQAYLGAIDMHRSNETRPLMSALHKVAERYQSVVVCVRHPAKPGQGGGKAIHRGLGSIDLIGAARSAIYVEAHPVDRAKVLLCQIKNNLGPHGRTQVFSKEHGSFAWAGVSRLTADHLSGSSGPHPQAMLEVFCWLEEALRNGTPQEAEYLQECMKLEGFKGDTIKRAKKMLGVKSKRNKEQWYWFLPPLEKIHPPQGTTASSSSSSSSYTSSSSSSLDISDSYQEEEEAVEDEVVEEEEVAGVLTARTRVATSMPENMPPCGRCGRTDRWHDTQYDMWRCVHCAPPKEG